MFYLMNSFCQRTFHFSDGPAAPRQQISGSDLSLSWKFTRHPAHPTPYFYSGSKCKMFPQFVTRVTTDALWCQNKATCRKSKIYLERWFLSTQTFYPSPNFYIGVKWCKFWPTFGLSGTLVPKTQEAQIIILCPSQVWYGLAQAPVNQSQVECHIDSTTMPPQVKPDHQGRTSSS